MDDVSPAARRLAKARARDDLSAPSGDEILAFQQSFLRQSGLLVFSDDPAVIRAARSKKPEPSERLASYMVRAFGSRDANVKFAQFVTMDGRSQMHSIESNNAGGALKDFLKNARRVTRKAVEETHAERVLSVKKRASADRERARRQNAEDRKRLALFPAEWLEDRASEAQELNDSASGTTVHDPRVIAHLRVIAREARAAAEAGGTEGTSLEVVVDKLITAYDQMARHENQRVDEVKQLREQLNGSRRN